MTAEQSAVEALERASTRLGFLTDDEITALAASEPYRRTQVLVRCGGCRFTCSVRDVTHLIALVESGTHHGEREYVRDVALTISVEQMQQYADNVAKFLKGEVAPGVM